MKPSSRDYAILYVDDEVKALKYFEAIFNPIAPIYIANSPEEGYRLFAEHHDHIAIVVSDKKMPGESGLDLLKRMRDLDPQPLRFLVTAFSDLDAAVASLNDGLLYSYLTKPWDPDELEHRLTRALHHFRLDRERERLVREKTEAFQHLLMSDKAASIGILSAGLNHHLRNALTVLRTFYDLLPYQLEEEIVGQPKDGAFWGEFYEEVGGQIDRMTAILTNLSEGTRISGLSLSEGIDLGHTIREAGTLVLEERPDLKVTYHIPECLPRMTGDREKLSQLGRFLFEETRGTLKEGAEIEVRLEPLDSSAAIELTFIDNGDPVPQEDLARLFDPFYVRPNRPEELGTNLMACYLTVFHHGGTIRAERTTDGRNALVIVLPVEPVRDEEDEIEASPRHLWRLADFSHRDNRPAMAALIS